MMKIIETIIAITLAILPVSALAVSQEQIELMEEAAPSEPFAEPQTERKMLIFSRCEGFAHSSIPYFEKAMEIVAQTTGAFSVDISTDMAVFEDGTLAQYDVLCFNNTTHLEPSEQQRQGILDFLAEGKGVVGIHGATDSFYQWQEGAEIMGGWFESHPWEAHGTWSIKVTEPNHPLNARFSEPTFKLTEEIYKLRWASLENLRILMELDFGDPATRAADESVDRVPISWVRTYGPGRVFYSGLGHNHDIFWNEEILNHFLAGIQYAAGDLDAPDEPLEDELTTRLVPLLDEAGQVQYGQNDRVLNVLEEIVRRYGGIEQARQVMERHFLATLQDDITDLGRDWLFRQLAVIGSAASVEVVGPMLSDPQTTHMARFALESIDAAQVDEALMTALGRTDRPAVKIGLISSLASRRYQGSADTLAKILTGADTDISVAKAAASALGKIGSHQVQQLLADARQELTGSLLRQVLLARLECAAGLAKAGDTSAAGDVYAELFNDQMPAEVRVAAMTAMTEMTGAQAQQMLIEALEDDEMMVRQAALTLSAQVQGDKIVPALGEFLRRSPPATQVAVLAALARRGDARAMPIVMQSCQSSYGDVRIAAFEALSQVADASAVEFLAQSAAQRQGAERDLAREALYALSGSADAVILQSLDQAQPQVKAELLRALGRRGIADSFVTLVEYAGADEEVVAAAAIESMQQLAGVEHFDQLAELLTNVSQARRGRVENVILSVLRRRGQGGDALADIVTGRFSDAQSDDIRVTYVRLLGHTGSQQAVDTVLAQLESSDEALKRAAIDAAGSMPGPKAAEALLEVARGAENQTHRVVALRAAVSQIVQCLQISEGKRLEFLDKCLDLAPDADETRRVLASLRDVHNVQAVKLAGRYLDQPDLGQQAAIVISQIAPQLSPEDLSEIVTILQKAVANAPNSQIRQDIDALLSQM